MKEKIGIEKLVELLNEYDSYNGWKETDEGIDNIWKIYEFHSELQIISKKYGFIKWLVENDKIDLNKVKGKSDRIYYKEYGSGGFTCSNEELVLMLLSISSSPIEVLISYLK